MTGLFHAFATFGVIGVFGLVTLSTAAVGVLTPDPTGTVWIAMAAFMGLMTLVLSMALYQFHVIGRPRFHP